MKNKNTLLLIAGAALLFFLLKGKKLKAASTPGNANILFEDKPVNFSDTPNITVAAPETVNFQQVVPTPSTVMDIPGISVKYEPTCCNGPGRQIGNMPFVC